MFAYDFHAGGETLMSRHFNDPNADAYFTKRKWGKKEMRASFILISVSALGKSSFAFENTCEIIPVVMQLKDPVAFSKDSPRRSGVCV